MWGNYPVCCLLPIHPTSSIHLFTNLSIYLFIHLSIHPSVSDFCDSLFRPSKTNFFMWHTIKNSGPPSSGVCLDGFAPVEGRVDIPRGGIKLPVDAKVFEFDILKKLSTKVIKQKGGREGWKCLTTWKLKDVNQFNVSKNIQDPASCSAACKKEQNCCIFEWSEVMQKFVNFCNI